MTFLLVLLILKLHYQILSPIFLCGSNYFEKKYKKSFQQDFLPPEISAPKRPSTQVSPWQRVSS